VKPLAQIHELMIRKENSRCGRPRYSDEPVLGGDREFVIAAPEEKLLEVCSTRVRCQARKKTNGENAA
jgi:hypothetical protein